jgi:hypothetical protein
MRKNLFDISFNLFGRYNQSIKKYTGTPLKQTLGYNKQIIIVYWFGSAWFRLFISWLLRTPLVSNEFGQSQAVHYNGVSLLLNWYNGSTSC